jgi:hypothetical protein
MSAARRAKSRRVSRGNDPLTDYVRNPTDTLVVGYLLGRLRHNS